jgi:hypothetical protein
LAPGNVDRVNAPAFIGATGIAGHSPAKPVKCGESWQVDHGRDEALGVATPSLTTRNRATAINADGAIIAPYLEESTNGKNILKRIPTVSAHLQNAPVEAEVWILARRFKIEIVPES